MGLAIAGAVLAGTLAGCEGVGGDALPAGGDATPASTSRTPAAGEVSCGDFTDSQSSEEQGATIKRLLEQLNVDTAADYGAAIPAGHVAALAYCNSAGAGAPLDAAALMAGFRRRDG